uniref:Glucose kinase n=1 Tax=uncultured Planctomycetota bacterium TaxID=120965 RepID=H5SJQ4_9BACT|nr:glucose kinase [uncultured Planctomycetota bacterium]
MGVEIGGTKLQVALGNGAGELWYLGRQRVAAEADAACVRQQIVQGIQQALEESGYTPRQIAGIGVGFGGPVDDERSIVLASFQVRGWAGFPIRDWLVETFGWPAVVCNDAAVAALAEAHFGAGRGCSPMFYMNVGSGIGGALVVAGRVYRGFGRGAGEIGHLWVDYCWEEPWPEPRRWRDLEAGSSGWAIERALARTLGEPCTVQEALRRLEQGDARIQVIWHQAIDRVALALSHVVALLAPKRIVIGGGVSLAGDSFFAPLREAFARLAFAPLADCDIVPAALGETVVPQGALLLARHGLDRLTFGKTCP